MVVIVFDMLAYRKHLQVRERIICDIRIYMVNMMCRAVYQLIKASIYESMAQFIFNPIIMSKFYHIIAISPGTS